MHLSNAGNAETTISSANYKWSKQRNIIGCILVDLLQTASALEVWSVGGLDYPVSAPCLDGRGYTHLFR